jgi:hypothetical protein
MADYTAGIRQAAAAAGVKTTTCSSHGTVEQWAACLNKAISSKANLVVLVGPVDLVALQAELAALKKAKVPVIAAHVPAPRDFAVGLDPAYERALSSLAAIVPAPFAQGARLMADYVIADANEAPSRILVTGASDMPESNAMVAAVQNELASSCGPSCTVSSLDVPFSTWQTKGYAAIANATLAQPTSYLVSVFDQFDGIAAEGIADARAASAAVIRPNICSFGGTPFAIQMGQAANRVVCDLAENMNWDGWATMDQAGFAAAAVVAAGLTALIVGLRPSLVGIGGGTAAAPNDFAQFDLGAPPNLPRNAIAWQSRVITSVRLRDGPHTLYVAPTAQGGFCYEWAGDGTGGCARLARGPLAADWDTGRVVGVVSSLVVSSVRITFSDGTSVAPPIAWIKAPINAGFFLYDIPRGKIVAEVSGDDDGRTLSQVTWYSL